MSLFLGRGNRAEEGIDLIEAHVVALKHYLRGEGGTYYEDVSSSSRAASVELIQVIAISYHLSSTSICHAKLVSRSSLHLRRVDNISAAYLSLDQT